MTTVTKPKRNSWNRLMTILGPMWTSVYRRSLSVYEGNTGALRTMGIIGTSVGGAALITGIVLLPIGLADDSDGLTTAGGLTLGLGAAVMTLGILAIRRDSPTYRPGASNHFSP